MSIEGLFPLIILGAGALIRHLKKKAKEQKERASLPPPIAIREVASPPSRRPAEAIYIPPVPKKIHTISSKKQKPRIAKLISGLKHKQNLVLLSEILVNKHQVK